MYFIKIIMKKVYLVLLVFSIFPYVHAQQTTKAIFHSGPYTHIGDFNPSDGSYSNLKSVVADETNPSDFIFDAKNGRAIIKDKKVGFIFCTISNNEISTKSFRVFNNIMAPAYIPSTERIVCLNVQKEFNGYGSNEDNLFFSSIDVNRGFTENLLKISDLSFDDVSAPFYGKTIVKDRFTQKDVEKDVAISKAVFIAEKNLYMVMARDVTGTNRLYKIYVSSPSAASMVSARCEYNIIDMVPIEGTDYLKVLFFTKAGSSYELKVGNMHIVNNTMSHVELISYINSPQIDNGSIQYNTDQTKLYVTRYTGTHTQIFSVDPTSNQWMSEIIYMGNVQFDFGFSDVYYKTQTLADLIGFYPNPSSGLVNLKNNTGIVPTSLKVYDNVGQLVRSILVEELSGELQIDLSDMARGIYQVRVEMPGEDYIGKIAITH